MTIRRVRMLDADYPAALHDLPCPPEALYIIGSLDILAEPIVAVVGTRNCTTYGERIATAVCAGLARAGACIISGMARGIDAIGHRMALSAGGRTAAVLGTGVDVAYPVGHRELHQRIGARGVLISEFEPGTTARKHHFPQRNRIIAALAPLTIVVEGGPKSGALNTAYAALDLGRTIAAVPGPIDAPQSEGTNKLLFEGAAPITSVEDALALAGLAPPPRTSHVDFGDAERSIIAELRRAPADLDSLASRTRLPSRECLRAVTVLELAGAIECALTGEIRLR